MKVRTYILQATLSKLEWKRRRMGNLRIREWVIESGESFAFCLYGKLSIVASSEIYRKQVKKRRWLEEVREEK